MTEGNPKANSSTMAARESYCPLCDSSYAPEVLNCPADGAQLIQLSEQRDELTGTVLAGRFTLKDRLGAGGMGTVYRAMQHSLGRPVAIKVISSASAPSRQAARRFLREAKLSSQLSHPNIVTIHDFGQSETGLLYLVMELVEGHTLTQLLGGKPLSIQRTVRIAAQLCDALTAAHRIGIVHRDLKCCNVIVAATASGDDLARVLDFGLAKSLSEESNLTELTAPGAFAGTPAYMAPEVIRDGDATASSDLYALGVMLFELLTGRRPFDGPTPAAILEKQLMHAAPGLPDDISPALRAIVERLLSKQPAKRFATAAEVRGALLAAITATRAPPPPAAPQHTATMGPSAAVVALQPTPQPTPAVATHSTADAPKPHRSGLVLALSISVAFLGLASYFVVTGKGDTPTADNQAAAAMVTATDATSQFARDAGAPATAETAAEAAPTDAAPAQPAADITVTITVTPRAKLTVNGRRVGKTPYKTTVRPGAPLELEARRTGYTTLRRTITPTDNGPIELSLQRRAGSGNGRPGKPSRSRPDAGFNIRNVGDFIEP